jgi:uncharacterized caspase-like protein
MSTFKKALVVGINKYQHAPLQGRVNDARQFADLMRNNGDGSPNFHTRFEENISTRALLREAITDTFSGQNDVVLFYFTGHGFTNERGGYILTPDYQKYDEGISMDEILLLANQSASRAKIIILDCCHSGAFGSPQILNNSESLVSYIKEGLTVLTSSRPDELSVESKENGHGLFTSFIIDALEGGAADLKGDITPGSIYAYIDQALGPWFQRPLFKTNISSFTVLRTVVPQVPIPTLRNLTEYFQSPNDLYRLDPSFEFTSNEANPKNVTIMKDLQKLQSVGLVVPVDEEFMFFAAMNSKSCKLTLLGHHYWRLVKGNHI